MRNSYILLRNKIESTSLNIEDLQAMDLQSSDLIWVECQSVYWQSPMEITELKALVNSGNKLLEKKAPELAKEHINKYQKLKSTKILSSQSVYVELPKSDKAELNNLIKNPMSDETINDFSNYGNPGNKRTSKFLTKKIIPKAQYDQPFTELKEPEQKQHDENSRLEKTIFGFELPTKVKKAAIYTVLIAAGAILMLLIMNKDFKNKVVIQPAIQQPEAVFSKTEVAPVEIEESNIALPESYEQENLPVNEPFEVKNEIKKPIVSPNKAKLVKLSEEKTLEDPITIQKNDSQPKSVSETKGLKKTSLQNVLTNLSLKANEYNVGSFGGIRNLEMTLHNNSKTFLTKVTVEINYLNPENNIVKKADVYFQSIEPGSTVTIPVKKTNRGVKIDFKVIDIETTEKISGTQQSDEAINYSRN